MFICENNFYGEFTPMQKVTGGADIAGRAAAYGMASALVDGNDLWAVTETARRGGRPCPSRRRPDAARGADLPPLRPLEVRSGDVPAQGGGRALDGARPARDSRAPGCIELGHGEDEIEAIEREVRETLDRAVEAALAAPYPDPETDGATEFAT